MPFQRAATCDRSKPRDRETFLSVEDSTQCRMGEVERDLLGGSLASAPSQTTTRVGLRCSGGGRLDVNGAGESRPPAGSTKPRTSKVNTGAHQPVYQSH